MFQKLAVMNAAHARHRRKAGFYDIQIYDFSMADTA